MTRRRDTPSIVECVTDPQLLGLSLSLGQETLLRGAYGLPLPTQDHRDCWHQCTGGRRYHEGRSYTEITAIAGARSGKDSRFLAPSTVYEAVFGDHEAQLARGERGMIPLVAQDARATRISSGYIFEYFRSSPLLRSLIDDERANELDLTNRITIACFPCTKTALRGWSNPVGGMNELGFWRLEGSADSDVEIQASIRRGMLSFPRPKLLKISTPYLRSGVLYQDFSRAWGQDDPDLLVWRATSRLMNPTITEARLERERRLDPVRFSREYEAEFSADVDAFLPSEWVDAAIVDGRHELPPRDGVRYVGTTDPSGGGADAFTLAICHVDGVGDEATLVLDVLHGRRRVGSQSPDLVGLVREYADVLRRYRIPDVIGDKYSGQWVRQVFAEAGIHYRDSPMDKSAAYLELQPWFAQGRVALLDHPTLARELKNLERRPRPGGKDVVDHPRGGSDDHSNVLALATVLAHPSRTVQVSTRAAHFAAAAITMPSTSRALLPTEGSSEWTDYLGSRGDY